MPLEQRFKQLVFAQVLLGIIAFCLAEANPGLLLIAGTLAALSWYVTEGPSGKTLPRWLVSLLSVAALGWLGIDLITHRDQLIIAMGHFMIGLQVLLLYSDRTNREQAQLLALSLLQMVAATTVSATMIFGAMLIAYCIIGLWTVLLFQLKTAADQVRDANRTAAPDSDQATTVRAVVGRGHRAHFRYTAATIALTCSLFSVLSFLAMPRDQVARFSRRLAETAGQREVGYADEVSLTGSAATARTSTEPVLHMRIELAGEPVSQTPPHGWLLRGTTLDMYNRQQRQWTRSPFADAWSTIVELEDQHLTLTDQPAGSVVLTGRFTLRDGTDRALFTPGPVLSLSSPMLDRVRLNLLDQRLSNENIASAGSLEYHLTWPAGPAIDIGNAMRRRFDPKWFWQNLAEQQDLAGSHYAMGWDVQRTRLEQLGREALAVEGLLPHDPATGQPPEAAAIASALARHLRANYSYSLDNPANPESDPIIAFLFEHRRGHCELFAAAHAALCRSLGVPARLVTGYRASEYNHIGDYFVVRKNHAHAWTEVYCGPELGWQTYDATPPDQVDAEHAGPPQWFAGLRATYDHLDYLWLKTVVTFDRHSQDAVLDRMRQRFATERNGEQTLLGRARATLAQIRRAAAFDRPTWILILVVSSVILAALIILARLTILHRRRLASLHLSSVPASQRRGMTRRLRFYLQMIALLEQHGHHRPRWQTPRQFSDELIRHHPHRFAAVEALTDTFYEIRFGHRALDTERRHHIRTHLTSLEQALAAHAGHLAP